MGLDYYVARFYDPLTAHFTQADTLIPEPGKASSFDRYAYVRNNPVRYNDPSGHWPIPLPSFITEWWFGSDVGYKGSGGNLGHGPRQMIGNLLGLGENGEVDNLTELLCHSLVQNENVNITGEALNAIRNDSEIENFKNELIAQAELSEGFGKEGFVFEKSKGITFGGDRSPEPMSDQLRDPFNPKYIDTWKTATNPTTWMVRWAPVNAIVSVSENGGINIKYSLTDTVDLREVEGRSEDYNSWVKKLGKIWHDRWGGNDKLKIHAKWDYEEE